jgi:SAM-dependent methyltransferase
LSLAPDPAPSSADADTKAGAALRAHLQSVHDAEAGFTERCAWACRNAEGLNSYGWLCEAARPPAGGAVLDIACGSGVMLELCRATYGPGVALSGVDMSPAELALAEARLTKAGVSLHEGLAQTLDFAGDDSLDAALCHWALTLMDPLEPVLCEVARVLRPGGVFAAVVDGPAARAAGYGEICALIDSHVRKAAPDYAELGDPRARDGEALAELARTAFPGAEVRVDSEVFALEDSPARLAEQTAGFFYSAFMVRGAARTAMMEALTAFFASQATPRYEMPVNRLVVVTPGPRGGGRP